MSLTAYLASSLMRRQFHRLKPIIFPLSKAFFSIATYEGAKNTFKPTLIELTTICPIKTAVKYEITIQIEFTVAAFDDINEIKIRVPRRKKKLNTIKNILTQKHRSTEVIGASTSMLICSRPASSDPLPLLEGVL